MGFVRRGTTRVAATLLVATLALAGCGNGDDAAQADADEAVTQPEDGITSNTAEAPDPTTIVDPNRGDPPTELVIEDIVEGEGDPVDVGSIVRVEYVGVAWSTGEVFDSSWDQPMTFDFELGAGRVITGWDEGLVGMRVGGRRVLTIPPEMAYGERGAGADIGPNETLVFVVDLVDADSSPTP